MEVQRCWRCLLVRILDGAEDPTDLPLALLEDITDNFSTERIIGQGGFGVVYKGVIGERSVAVKRIHINENTVDDRLFRREYVSQWNTSHRNVVRILGFCSNTHQKTIEDALSGGTIWASVLERLLYFEYISNGSLDNHITDELRGLEWETRYEIIIGICKGLFYLHKEKSIIHMDLKPANILLHHQDDKYLVPKITDFGLSRPNENSHTVGKVHGTRGYMAPEYREGSKTAPACDIYSLGLIIIELVTGCMEVPNKDNVLRRWRHRWTKPPTQLRYQQVTRCMEIAGRCRAEKPGARPSISEIISFLNESESTYGPISPYLDEDAMLRINPLERRLPYELKNKKSFLVELTNGTRNCIIAFNIDLPNRQYIAKPVRGIVRPGSMYGVTITVQAQDVREHNHTDKLIVRSMQVEATEVHRDEDIEERMFDNTSKFVDKVDLLVVYGRVKPQEDCKLRGDSNMLADKVLEAKKRNVVESAFGKGKNKLGSSKNATSKMERQLPQYPTHLEMFGAWSHISAPERMNTLLGTTLWAVDKALAPVTDGLLGDWDSSKNLGLNIEALGRELLLVKAMLETASHKHITGQAMEVLLWRLQDSVRSAEDLLDELDYFRIDDKLHIMYEDHHAKGGVNGIALKAPHIARALIGLSPSREPGKVLEDARQHVARQRSHHNSPCSSTQAEEEEVNRYMPKIGKLLPCPNVHDVSSTGHSTLCGAPQRGDAAETQIVGFNRVDVSERTKYIVEQIQLDHRDFTTILQTCDRIIDSDIAQSRPVTTGRSIEPKLYGRDNIMNSIIHDMTKDKYHNKDLTVLPIVGPGGIGKTTMIQHIYHNKEVQSHFQVVIWVCVSLKFNLNKLLEDIKKDIPQVEGEKGYRPEELIEQRLKSKRFLIVLDDIWECNNEEDWERLLLPLKISQEKGSTILVTTRFPAVAKMIGTTDSVELEGLESKYFRELFHAFVFADDQSRRDHIFLLETGDKIMEKLKGSPLAAKTVGKLLRKNLNLGHWRRVLESKEWERRTGVNDIMPALKLSYDYLPFRQQQCFSYSALFPQDYKYSTTELINLWIGLDILQLDGRNKTLKDMGLSILNDLVTHGFYREEETDNDMHYVMHDLLHDLALKIASHECLTVHKSNVGSLEIQPSVRYLSIIIDDDDKMSHENFKSEVRKLKTRLKVKQLHTLMLFGNMDESFVSILGDLFGEANGLRVLHLVGLSCSGESMLHNLSSLVHLRYLCLGTVWFEREMHLPLAISRLYHLRVLDLGSWYYNSDLPKDLSNLAKLHHFYTPSDEDHSDVLNVGKLVLLEELKIFRVNKESEGFELKQLEHLTKLRELGIYNLENIHTKEEATKAKLIEKNFLARLTLDWDNKRSNTKPSVDAVVLESLQPHRYLEELCIRGYRGSTCPTWMGDELAVEALESLHLDDVSRQCLPSFGKMQALKKVILKRIAGVKEFVIEQSFCRLIRLELVDLESFDKWVPSEGDHMFPHLQVLIIEDCPKLMEVPLSNLYSKPDQGCRNIDWFPKLQELEIKSCPKLLLVAHIPWSEALCRVNISDVMLLEKFKYNSKSSKLNISGKDDLHSLDQVLAFSNLTGLKKLTLAACPPLELKHLVMLTSLKKLEVHRLDGLVGPLGGEGDVEWQHPVEYLDVRGSASGKQLAELLTHLSRLSRLVIWHCQDLRQLAVGVDVTSAAASKVEKEEDGLLLLPTHLSPQELRIFYCHELVLVDPLTFFPAGEGGDGAAMRSLLVCGSHRFLSAINSFSRCLFPSSLQELELDCMEGMGTLEPLSNLTSLTRLELNDCGEDLICKGLGPLLTNGGQLRELTVLGSPRFFAGWYPNPPVLLQEDGGREEQQLVSQSKLQVLYTDDAAGLLAVPICSLLSSSLTELYLHANSNYEVERFTKEQEDALHLIVSLQELTVWKFSKLQHLPAGLHKLPNLKRLEVVSCPFVRSLPKDGLPKSLQELVVRGCGNEELKQQCRGLVGTIPEIKVEYGT